MSKRQQRGVSLIEALVAFAIMAFGMLAVVGMQATMRSNADLARQRAEAVRLAQDAIEEWRGFSTIATTTGHMAFADISGNSTRTVSGTNYNATYTVTRTAVAPAAVDQTVTPALRGVIVDVTWADRTNQAQQVRLSSSIVGLAPDLSASLVLSTATDPLVAPLNRHRAIPPGAVQMPVSVCASCSGYVPPGQSGNGSRVAWLFNNSTAVITVCSTNATSTSDLSQTSTTISNCSDTALLISGYVNFAQSGMPGAGEAANPQGSVIHFGLSVSRTSPAGASAPTCFQGPATSHAMPYLCAVPITASTPNWSGGLVFGDPLDISSSLSDTRSGHYKVCRYDPVPAVYSAVTNPLTNQNFLIIQSGNGNGLAYSCPVATPSTSAHQPNA